ncbi:ribonuclease H-like domain-containing protein [Tanacetum coccineum]
MTTEILEGFDVQRTSGLGDTLRKYGHLTQSITQCYKSLGNETEDQDFPICPPFDQFIDRCKELDEMTVSDVFATQLLQVPQVTEEVAIAVLDLYPTVISLARAYSHLIDRLPHPGQSILGPAPAIYASQATTLPSAFNTMPLQDSTWHMDTGIVKPIDRLFLHTSSISPIPKNPSDALKDPQWRNAMYDGYNALVKNDTWLLVPRPAGVNMVRSMWLFKHKFHADGTLSRYKARLVVNGSSQQLGVDFDETFSPVVKLATICTVLSLVVSRQWPIYQLDVKNAFLNGLFLSQRKYVLHLLERAYMVNCNPYRPPVDTESKLGPEGVPVQDPTLYRSLVGGYSILHLHVQIYLMSLTRFAFICMIQRSLTLLLSSVSCVMFEGLWTLVSSYMLSINSLVGYTNAYWAGCSSTRSSTSGYCIFLGDNLLSWSAKRQHTLSRSSAKAEYCGVANVVAETAWLHNLLRELHSPPLIATLVYCDNVSVVYMSANPVQHQRTKHIEIDIHFVRDMVTAGEVRVLHVPSRYHYADIFTKGLPSALFEEFRSSLSVHPPPAPTAGAY